MNIEIINTGSELMLGRVLNTHQQWLCRQLADLGYEVTRQVAVADTGREIQKTVREALGRADLILVTGGLGPTSDDLTRDLIAELLGKKLHEDAAIVAHIESFFVQRNRPMPVSTRVQAMVPEGAIVLHNQHGTAPGLVMKIEDRVWRLGSGEGRADDCASPDSRREPLSPKWLVMLPGPPRELRPMFTAQVAPLMQKHLPLEAAFVCRTLKTTGIGESFVEEKIAAPLRPLTDAGLEIGYCARVGEVDVRFIARGCGAEKAVNEARRVTCELLGQHIFGEGDDSLEGVIVRLLTERKQTLALAESCTGGFIANRITNVPGASAVFRCGLVTYSNEAKQQLLGVRAETLAVHGAVSELVAREMAEGARLRCEVDFALAVTGIAGPDGGSEAKPVGKVFIALATADKTTVLNPVNRYDRETFKYVTSQQALELLRRSINAA